MNDELLYAYKDYYNNNLDSKYRIFDDNFEKMLEAKRQDKPLTYLDFHKLLFIVKTANPYKICIGLKEDWKATNATIYDQHQWIQTEYGDYYVMSIWDKPILRVYLHDSEQYIEIECSTQYKQCADETYEGENGAIIEQYEGSWK